MSNLLMYPFDGILGVPNRNAPDRPFTTWYNTQHIRNNLKLSIWLLT